MRKTLGLLAIFWTAAFLPMLVATPAHACRWTFYGMYQDGSLPAGYWWKPILTVKGPEECRAMVKTATGRPVAGIQSWYHFPALTETSPSWLKQVVAAMPKGGADPWVGCLPSDLNPSEPR